MASRHPLAHIYGDFNNPPAQPNSPGASASLAAAKQRAADSLQRLRYAGGQARADAQKQAHNH